MMGRTRLFGAATVILLSGLTLTGQVKDFNPVTDAMLQNPDPADWPNWRRTLDGWGYSPLNQINTQNVRQLQLAWSWGLSPGLSQPTPLVANGTMYVPSPGGGVQALDAANGDLLWEYRNAPMDGGPVRTSPMRNLAIYGDIGAGLSDYLCGRRQAVSRGSGWHRRRTVEHDDPRRAHAGEENRPGRERDVRIRFASALTESTEETGSHRGTEKRRKESPSLLLRFSV
jgi:hypothetical protein